jgi:hypothetical protein
MAKKKTDEDTRAYRVLWHHAPPRTDTEIQEVRVTGRRNALKVAKEMRKDPTLKVDRVERAMFGGLLRW